MRICFTFPVAFAASLDSRRILMYPLWHVTPFAALALSILIFGPSSTGPTTLNDSVRLFKSSSLSPPRSKKLRT